MNRWPIILLLLAIAGCRSASHEEADAHGEHHEHGAHEEHDDQVGHIRLTAAQQTVAGIEIGTAGPRTLAITQELPGEVVVNADRLAHIVPRFPGIAQEVRAQLGESVHAGEVLAIIESNESLSPYEVKSLIAGTVIEKHITLGEFVRDDSDIYMIADLSTVWVNVTVYARDLPRIRRGQRVTIRGAGHEATAEIGYVGPVIGEATRTAVARVVLPNPRGHWRPGLFVTAAVELEQAAVPVAIPDDAIQTLEGKPVVFVAEDAENFAPRPVALGLTGDEWTEILSGLTAGERVVTKQSFILKSEHGKSEASHEH